jgi:hypothetical protein
MTVNTTYDILKEISHLSLAILSQFGHRCGRALNEDQITDFKLLLIKMYESIGRVYFIDLIPDNLIQDQVVFIGESISLVERLLEKKLFDCYDLHGYINSSKPILDKNVYAAAKSQLEDLHKLVKSWIAKYTQIDWKRIFILICSAHMPRDQNILSQYFQKLIGIEFEGDQFVYAEAFDDDVCKGLLKTHITDKEIGVNLFNEGMRMHRDLLADAAAQIIPQILPTSLNEVRTLMKFKRNRANLNFRTNEFLISFYLFFIILFI